MLFNINIIIKNKESRIVARFSHSSGAPHCAALLIGHSSVYIYKYRCLFIIIKRRR